MSEIREHGRLLAASALSVGLGLGGMSVFLLGVFAAPVTAELGWSLAFFQSAALLLMPAMVLAGPVVGALADRHGSRAVALPALALFAIGLASLGLATASPWTWILPWLLMGLAGTGTTGVAWAPAITAHFDRQRGLALAIMLSGSSLMAIVGPSVARLLIEALGWRLAYLTLGALPLVLATAGVAVLTRRDAAPRSPAAKSAAHGVAPADAAGGMDLRSALREPRFWRMAAAFSLVMLAVGGLIANLVPILVSRGQTPAAAAGLAGILGAALISGRLLTGRLVDRFAPQRVAALALLLSGLSPLLLLRAEGALAAAVGIALLGLAAGAEFDLVAYLVGRIFGRRQFGRIYAFATIPPTITASLGAPAIALVRDATGSFTAVAWPAALVVLAGASLLPGLRMAPAARSPALHTDAADAERAAQDTR